MSILDGLTPAQRDVAEAIVATVRRHHLPWRAAVCALATGLVESGLQVYANRSVPSSMTEPHTAVGSDHDSVGVFQQRVPSWGTAADCMNVVKSCEKFLGVRPAGNNPGLTTLPGYRFAYVGYPNATRWDQIPVGNACQAVQVSAFPDRYAEHEPTARALVTELWTSDLHTDTVTEGNEYMIAIRELKGSTRKETPDGWYAFAPGGLYEGPLAAGKRGQLIATGGVAISRDPMTLEQHDVLRAFYRAR